jgi:hypothetical protein
MQSVFSPRQGFDLKNDIINGFLASVSLDYGKIVEISDSTNYLALGNEYGYFLMENVTASGPTNEEYILGDYQYEKKAGANTAVCVLVPKRGAIVRTAWCISGEMGPVAGIPVDISGGVFTGESVSTAPKGRIKAVITDSTSTTLYDIEIL